MMTTVLAIGMMMCATPTPSDAAWWDADWQYRQYVSIDASRIDEDLARFPLYLMFTDSQFARTLAQPDGGGLRAVSASGKLLNMRVVSWTTDDVRICVQMPHVRAQASGQGFYLYFGNPDARPLDDAKVWDKQSLSVTHLINGASEALRETPSVQAAGFVNQAGWAPGIYLGHHHPWVTLERGRPGFLDFSEDVAQQAGPDFTFACRFRPRGEGRLTLFSADGVDLFADLTRVMVETDIAGADERASLSVEGVSQDQWHSVVFSYGADGQRILCVDGTLIAQDSVSQGPFRTGKVRIGRALSDAADTQFSGDLEEIRLLDAAQPPAWVTATAYGLAETSLLTTIGALESEGKTSVLAAPPQLLSPYDHMQSHRPTGTELRWRPSVGAAKYAVRLYADEDATDLLKSIDAGTNTALHIDADTAGADAIYWTVAAVSEDGSSAAMKPYQLTFYDWNTPPQAVPAEAVAPELERPSGLSIELDGYLKERIDKLVEFWIAFPDKNPGMLRSLRERPEPGLPPWAGIYGGQYISCGQSLWRLTHDDALKKRLDSFVREYVACQREDGYLGPFEDLTNPIDIWSHYAIIEGLVSYYEDTGYEPALDAARGVADLVLRKHGPATGPFPKIGGGTESISHGFILLYRHTRDPRYLAFANYIIHEGGTDFDGTCFYPLARERKPLADFPACRWEGIHSIQTFAELYWLNGDADYRDAFTYLWWLLVKTERHNNGGLTTDEALLGTPYHPGAIETCCTVAWIYLSMDMLRLTGDARVADELEWSTLNAALGAIPYDGSFCAYANQPGGHREYCFLRQGPEDSPFLSCCSTNVARGLGAIADWALLRGADGLYLNFFGPSAISASLTSGNRVTLKQDTQYPAQEDIKVEVAAERPEEFTMYFRIPKWSAETQVKVNGKLVQSVVPGTYLPIRRTWNTGDVVELNLDFSLRFWAGEEHYANEVSVYRGPILLSWDSRFNESQGEVPPSIGLKGLHAEPDVDSAPEKAWFLVDLAAPGGETLRMSDYASAGITGSYYQSWLDCEQCPPSPFHLMSPRSGSAGDRLTWEKRLGATSWTVYVSPTRDLAEGKRYGRVRHPWINVPDLKAGRYYWTVVAHNPHGEAWAANGPFEVTIE